MIPRIKRGASFEGALVFNDPGDDARWAALRPDLNEVRAVIRVGDLRFPGTVSVLAGEKKVLFSFDTLALPLGRALFDLWIIGEGKQIPLPWATSYPIDVVEGAGP